MKNEEAVSPVVGVMLMLVVTIIIAAVVSAFAGGLVDSTESTPSITMDVGITNSGRYASSMFVATVNSVSDAIKTEDLKLTTTWTATNHSWDDEDSEDLKTITRVTTVTSADNVFGWTGGGMLDPATAPWGYGAGIVSQNSGKPGDEEQQFGNYVLIAGTSMKAYPAGQAGGWVGTGGSNGYGIDAPYEYTDTWVYTAGTTVDGMQAVLGDGWENLRAGDIVTVALTYTPSGRTVFEKDVVVEE